MTDNEIINALNGNISNAKKIDCKVWSIEVYKLENALDLINRQKAENERLKVDLAKCSISLDNLYQTAAEIKSEAIKEFAERLKCGVPQETGVIRCADVDNLVKEMTEVNENDKT